MSKSSKEKSKRSYDNNLIHDSSVEKEDPEKTHAAKLKHDYAASSGLSEQKPKVDGKYPMRDYASIDPQTEPKHNPDLQSKARDQQLGTNYNPKRGK